MFFLWWGKINILMGNAGRHRRGNARWGRQCGHLAGVLVSAVDVWVMWAVVTPGVDVERVGRMFGSLVEMKV